MKKNFMFVGIAALMLAGCSSDDLVKDEGLGEATGEAYVGLKLQLPTVSGNGTRASETFVEATDEENAVKNLTIVLLNKDTKKVNEVINVNASELHWTDDPSQGIGTVAELPVQKVASSAEQSVLILINNTKDGTADKKIVNLTQGNNVPSDAIAFDANYSTPYLANNTSGFFMTNAVLANSNTSPSSTSYLVNVTPKSTKAEAQADAANNVIYVERAVGKVKLEHVSLNWTDWKYTINSSDGYNGSTIKFTDWDLDVTNKEFYAVRKFVDSWLNIHNRFYEGTAIPNRVYWAESPSYSSYDDNKFDVILSSNSAHSDVGNNAMSAALYCPENTFQRENMTHRQTTRALLKAVYTPKKVMLKGTSDTDWKLQEPGSGMEVETAITEGSTWYRLGNSSNAWVEASLYARIKKYLRDEEHLSTIQDVKIDNLIAGTHDFSESVNSQNVNRVWYSTDGSSWTEVSGDVLTRLKSAFGKLTVFKDGICYYEVRIQHFGSKYTPWGNETNAPEIDGTKFVNYLDNPLLDGDKNYLGRYGIVRNNLYELTLYSVSAAGAPTVDDLKPDSSQDDVQNYYIQATVKILDWAKRSQSVDL